MNRLNTVLRVIGPTLMALAIIGLLVGAWFALDHKASAVCAQSNGRYSLLGCSHEN